MMTASQSIQDVQTEADVRDALKMSACRIGGDASRYWLPDVSAWKTSPDGRAARDFDSASALAVVFSYYGLPSPPVEMSAAGIAAAIEQHVDDVARSRDYTNAADIASYASSANASWQAEAVAFIAWRDHVWASGHALIEGVTAGTMTAPLDASAVVDGLPQINWPDATS